MSGAELIHRQASLGTFVPFPFSKGLRPPTTAASLSPNAKMKRHDLARLARTQTRIAFPVLTVVLGFLGLAVAGIPERINRAWQVESILPALAPFCLIVIVALAVKAFREMPRCPHCRRPLTGSLLHIAIASGNCGYCGKSIED